MNSQNNSSPGFTPRATLAAIGLKLTAIDLFAPIREKVKISQKTIRYSPTEKLEDAFINILAGAKGMSEINSRLRADKALQKAFGRPACAEQSTVQDTLSAATAENVTQLAEASAIIYRKYSLAYRHNYHAGYQLLEVDITGLPCGPTLENSRKGYFDKDIRYGRQLGRVSAVHYDEIVVDHLYPGNVQLQQSLRELVEAAEKILDLTAEKRQRTIIRMDSGGGKYDDINWLLERGYKIHCREYSSRRVSKAAEKVAKWIDDTKVIGRQFGWLPANVYIENVYPYVRPVRRLITRQPKKEGGYIYGTMLVSNLEPSEIIALLQLSNDTVKDEAAVTRAYAHFYDLRSGGIEIDIKEDKQGIGITKRSKKKFTAQQMIMLLGQLAHNVLVWARHWLAPASPRLTQYGILRLVRDVMSISGFVKLDRRGFIIGIVLNSSYRLSYELAKALRSILPECIKVSTGIS